MSSNTHIAQSHSLKKAKKTFILTSTAQESKILNIHVHRNTRVQYKMLAEKKISEIMLL